MVTGIPEAQATQQPTPTPDPSNAAAAPQSVSSDQSLGQGFAQQAPEPTDGGQSIAGAPEPQPQTPQPQISLEEFQRIQAQLQEKDNLLNQVKQLAEQQQAQAREQEFRQGIRQQLETELKRVINSDDEGEIVNHLYGVVNTIVDNVTGQYQQQFQSYEEQVRNQFWQITANGYADHLIQQYQLPPQVKDDLTQFSNEQDMTRYALRMQATLATLTQQQQQQAIAQAAQDRRDSGAFLPSGGGQPGSTQPIQSGTARELMPALRRILGA